MRTVKYNILEKGDSVVVRSDWRDWKIGEIAEVIDYAFERYSDGSQGLQQIRLRNQNEHDFDWMYAYNVLLNKDARETSKRNDALTER